MTGGRRRALFVAECPRVVTGHHNRTVFATNPVPSLSRVVVSIVRNIPRRSLPSSPITIMLRGPPRGIAVRRATSSSRKNPGGASVASAPRARGRHGGARSVRASAWAPVGAEGEPDLSFYELLGVVSGLGGCGRGWKPTGVRAPWRCPSPAVLARPLLTRTTPPARRGRTCSPWPASLPTPTPARSKRHTTA
jgi:hypothetical protein